MTEHVPLAMAEMRELAQYLARLEPDLRGRMDNSWHTCQSMIWTLHVLIREQQAVEFPVDFG